MLCGAGGQPGLFQEFIFNILIFPIIEWKHFSKRENKRERETRDERRNKKERKIKSRNSFRTLSHSKAMITALRGESHAPPMKLGWVGRWVGGGRDHSHQCFILGL